jgi:ParB-like nuclease domain
MAVLPLNQINRKSGAQMRHNDLVDEHVASIQEAYHAGANVPPPLVFYDESSYWLAEGFHRVEAAVRAGLNKLDVVVLKGSQRDAILHGIGANSYHGLKRTGADKRRAIATLLEDDQWGKRSIKWLAKTAKVSEALVRKLADKLGNKPKKRTGYDGKSHPTSHAMRRQKGLCGTEAEMAPVSA